MEIVPISICVVLPIAIVLIISLTKINGDNQRTKILLKAIESNKEVDTDKLLDALKKPRRSATELLNLRLLRGCICTLIGLGFITIGIVNWCRGELFDGDDVLVPLVFGGIPFLIGVSYLIVYFVTRKELNRTND